MSAGRARLARLQLRPRLGAPTSWQQVSLLSPKSIPPTSTPGSSPKMAPRRRDRDRRGANPRPRPTRPALGIAAVRQSLFFDDSSAQAGAGSCAADHFDGGGGSGRNGRLRSFRDPPTIKWPNDILVDGKKLAGILTESACDAERVDYVILGIGVNLNYRRRGDAGRDSRRAPLRVAELTGKIG